MPRSNFGTGQLNWGPPVCVTSINPDGPDAVELSSLDTREAFAGTVMRLEQTGGSGYGNPKERDSSKVLEDVRNGYVSVEAACKNYGVVISDGKIDETATLKLRS